MIMLHFWYFNQFTNDYFLLFVFFFLLQFGTSSMIDFYSWLRIYYFLISVFMVSVIHLASGLFINFSLNGAQESIEIVKKSLSICTWASTLYIKVVFASNVTQKIPWSTDSFITVPPRVNGGDVTWWQSLSYSHLHSFPKGHTSNSLITPITNSVKITNHGLWNCYSIKWR